MNLSDWIRTFPNVLSAELCKTWCVDLDTSPYTTRIDHDYLRCDKLALEHSFWAHTRTAIADAFDEYKVSVPHNGNLNFCTHMEVPSVVRYRGGTDDHFHVHADNWSADSALRQVSVIAFLNDVERGGETYFPGLHLDEMPRRGSMLFFPSFFPYLHTARPPVSGDKYVLVTWICYPPTKGHYRVEPLR